MVPPPQKASVTFCPRSACLLALRDVFSLPLKGLFVIHLYSIPPQSPNTHPLSAFGQGPCCPSKSRTCLPSWGHGLCQEGWSRFTLVLVTRPHSGGQLWDSRFGTQSESLPLPPTSQLFCFLESQEFFGPDLRSF